MCAYFILISWLNVFDFFLFLLLLIKALLWCWRVPPQLYCMRIITRKVPMPGWLMDLNGQERSSPLVNCAKIGLSYFVRAINGPAPYGVCMINFSFLSKASWSPLAAQQTNHILTHARHGAEAPSRLVGTGGGGDSPCPFTEDPVQCVKGLPGPADSAETHIGYCAPRRFHSS